MTDDYSPVGFWRVVRLFLLSFLPVIVGCFLPGCASSSANQSGPSLDLITDSDETSDRKRARIRVELALGYFEQGKSNIALDEVKQAILADPQYSEAHNLRGLIYMRLNDFSLAEESFKKVLTLKPSDANVMHNLGWLKCQQAQYVASADFFAKALAVPVYVERAKTYMAQGLCQVRAGQLKDAEASLVKAYEYDAGNPVTGFHLASLLFQNKEDVRAQFYIRRLNNSEWANAESLWLGLKIEKRVGNSEAVRQLGMQLEKRFPQSREAALYRRSAFDE